MLMLTNHLKEIILNTKKSSDKYCFFLFLESFNFYLFCHKRGFNVGPTSAAYNLDL